MAGQTLCSITSNSRKSSCRQKNSHRSNSTNSHRSNSTNSRRNNSTSNRRSNNTNNRRSNNTNNRRSKQHQQPPQQQHQQPPQQQHQQPPQQQHQQPPQQQHQQPQQQQYQHEEPQHFENHHDWNRPDYQKLTWHNGHHHKRYNSSPSVGTILGISGMIVITLLIFISLVLCMMTIVGLAIPRLLHISLAGL